MQSHQYGCSHGCVNTTCVMCKLEFVHTQDGWPLIFNAAENTVAQPVQFAIPVSTPEPTSSQSIEVTSTNYQPKRKRRLQLGNPLTESAIETCKAIGVAVAGNSDITVPTFQRKNQLSADACDLALADLEGAKPYDPTQKPKNTPRPKSKSIEAAKKHISQLETQLASFKAEKRSPAKLKAAPQTTTTPKHVNVNKSPVPDAAPEKQATHVNITSTLSLTFALCHACHVHIYVYIWYPIY